MTYWDKLWEIIFIPHNKGVFSLLRGKILNEEEGRGWESPIKKSVDLGGIRKAPNGCFVHGLPSDWNLY